MPLRSVEAATREDAIAAAREQFGPDARIVGVRRVRSGGVLGFFTTERYVARVAPDPLPAPGGPAAMTHRSAAAATASFGSPLSSAPPARARAAAPARNGAAAWAAEASRATTARPASRGTRRDGDEERLDELFGLLDPAPAAPVRTAPAAPVRTAPAAPVRTAPERGTPAPVRAPSAHALHGEDDARPFSPVTFPRATRQPGSRGDETRGDDTRGDEARGEAARAATSGRHRAPTPVATPSPFTAALARMIAGDREVHQAVAEALEEPAGPASELARGPVTGASSAAAPEEAAPRPSLAAAIRSAHASMRSPAGQEGGTPVGNQAPAPTPTIAAAPVDPLPSADPAQVEAPAASTRQEEIAEALRGALAQGSSDEALAGILRTLLAGYSPSAAVAEPRSEHSPLDAPADGAAESLPGAIPMPGEPAAREPAPLADDRSSAVAVAQVAEPGAASTAGDATEVADVPVETRAVAEVTSLLARTASDPAPVPMSFDATTVMPRVSLLPPLAGSRGRGLPPVPPPSRPESRPGTAPAAEHRPEGRQVSHQPAPAPRALATVTRLPVGPFLVDGDTPDVTALDDAAAEVPAEPTPADGDATTAPPATDVVARLLELGVPRDLLGEDAATRIRDDGVYGALTRALGARLPEAPGLPTEAGDVLFVVGPGAETLRAARALAASLRLDPDRVQWATRGDLARLAPKSSRLTSVEAATDRRQEVSSAATVTIVAVEVPLRGDVYWMTQMLTVWAPVAVWAVVEATRKPEPVELWLEGLARVDALMVQDTELSADPAAVLDRLTVPVALLDGVRATPHRWASVLCERLDVPQA